MKALIISLALLTSISSSFSSEAMGVDSTRIQKCFKIHSQSENQFSIDLVGVFEVELGRAFVKCQAKQDGNLTKNDQTLSSGEIISELGYSLIRDDINDFTLIFNRLVK